MTRPAPRKSSLAGTSPLTPPAAPIDTAAAHPTQTPSGGEAGSAVKYPRLNYYVGSKEEAGRIRAAFLAGRSRYGWRTFSEMQRDAILSVVEQIERELNNGHPFEAASPGSVPAGRGVE